MQSTGAKGRGFSSPSALIKHTFTVRVMGHSVSEVSKMLRTVGGLGGEGGGCGGDDGSVRVEGVVKAVRGLRVEAREAGMEAGGREGRGDAATQQRQQSNWWAAGCLLIVLE